MSAKMLDRFYLIVDSADWLVRLLPCGVKLVQLRVKDKDDATLRAEIARARDLCRAHGAQLVVNDYWRLAIDLGCDYVHLGQEDMDSADFTAIRAAGMRIVEVGLPDRYAGAGVRDDLGPLRGEAFSALGRAH